MCSLSLSIIELILTKQGNKVSRLVLKLQCFEVYCHFVIFFWLGLHFMVHVQY